MWPFTQERAFLITSINLQFSPLFLARKYRLQTAHASDCTAEHRLFPEFCRKTIALAQIGDQFSGILNRFTVNLVIFFDIRFHADRFCIGVRFKETHISTEHFL